MSMSTVSTCSPMAVTSMLPPASHDSHNHGSSAVMIVYVSERATYVCHAGDVAPCYPNLPHLAPDDVRAFYLKYADSRDGLGEKTRRNDNKDNNSQVNSDSFGRMNDEKVENCAEGDNESGSSGTRAIAALSSRLSGHSVVLILPILSRPEYRAEVVFMLTHTTVQVQRVLVVSDTMADSLACGMMDGLVIHLLSSRSVIAKVSEGSTTRYVVTRAGAPCAECGAPDVDTHNHLQQQQQHTEHTDQTGRATQHCTCNSSVADASRPHHRGAARDVLRHSASDRQTIRQLLVRVTRGETHCVLLTGEALAIAGVRARWLHVLRECGLHDPTSLGRRRQARSHSCSSSPHRRHRGKLTRKEGNDCTKNYQKAWVSAATDDTSSESNAEEDKEEVSAPTTQSDAASSGDDGKSGGSSCRHSTSANADAEEDKSKSDADDGKDVPQGSSTASTSSNSSSVSSDVESCSPSSVCARGVLVMQPTLPLTGGSAAARVSYTQCADSRNGLYTEDKRRRSEEGGESDGTATRGAGMRQPAMSRNSRCEQGECGAPDDCCRWLSLIGGGVIGSLPQNEIRMMWLLAEDVQRTRGAAVHWKSVW